MPSKPHALTVAPSWPCSNISIPALDVALLTSHTTLTPDLSGGGHNGALH